MAADFFNESKDQSKVKSIIVQKYFWAWAKVIIGSMKRYPKYDDKIAYIDLFAGPGRYKDGTKSTPLLVLEKAIEDPDMAERLVTLFNDGDGNNTQDLEKAILELEGIDKLKYQPSIMNNEIGTEIVKEFESRNLAPTLFFVDPWGYKGLSLRLINSVLKHWGCDCVFFFNYNRVNMGLSNDKVKVHMEALFGDRTESLVSELEGLSPIDREFTIVENLCNSLIEMGGKYVLPFTFKNETGKRTSHHLIFVSKNFKGYEIMKNIMANESSSENQGVASFDYNPVDENYPFLFQFTKPLDDLKIDLLKVYSGKSLKMKEIYEQHNVGTPYISKNYKKVLLEMEKSGDITVTTSKRRTANTFADHLTVNFLS